ncbi:MAG: hypothetical protein NC548_13050 [Lachnospiraceae bacterium]|nr:hypothetical protein [Lachnospiraceae bacterium]MCM1230683.1 hypothetical protein [Ruminococcus flavefaciens]
MSDEMNRWSPFDPNWYQYAFDKFISTADQLFNQNEIISQGYHIPDADGSRSSVFRNEAVLNNSFSEKDLRETLKDIYLNTSHRLVASNHDNTHFYQWHGRMSDMKLIPNTNLCEFKIPVDQFIDPKSKDKYKLSQFARKWVNVGDILNNWDIFKWYCMLFINQKIYSDYEFRMDDHEVTIRFPYLDYWLKKDFSVYIYKFDTKAQCRIKVSQELCKNQWKWKMPASYITDPRVANSTHMIGMFNKLGASDRTDGLTHIEVLGDNIEFLKMEDGIIDLSNISDFNNRYIRSESVQYLWMSIVVPKFFNEYPILLPTDSIFRPYEANFQPVLTMGQYSIQHVKSLGKDESTQKQVYVDLNNRLGDESDGWKTLIRPIVLSDAFDHPDSEPYNHLSEDVKELKELTIEGAGIIDEFRFTEFALDSIFNRELDKVVDIIDRIREADHAFMDSMLIEYDKEYEGQYEYFLKVIEELRIDGFTSHWLHPISSNDPQNFWNVVSPLIYIPRELADKYEVGITIASMKKEKIVWSGIEENLNKVRFQRPIDVSDFWTFEYDVEDKVWRPYPLELERHFPDVYTLKDPTEEIPSLNRIFKAFFFYSDTMNVRNESRDIDHASPSWDDDMAEYHFDQEAVYRDIFMEKFYWMGIRSIYKGILTTENRWEAIEYVIDNDSYKRFNDLFLNTMDPYFKLGLATYLKSSNYEFPFDDAVSKMHEAINSNWLGYKKIANFEMYLNKNWIPSYFDYIVKIMDNWDYSNRLLKRPRNTFDIRRFLPVMLEVQAAIYESVKTVNVELEWIIEHLEEEDYHLNVENFYKLQEAIQDMYANISDVYKFTQDLDLEIYSNDDINYIIDCFKKHSLYTERLRQLFNVIREDTETHKVYEEKKGIILSILSKADTLPYHIKKISDIVQSFDMNQFMLAINDLRSYFTYNKYNPDDKSLIGYLNKFNDPWCIEVKEARNKLFVSTTKLFDAYDPNRSYSNDEIMIFVNLTKEVKDDVISLENSVKKFWTRMGYEKDIAIEDRLEYLLDILQQFLDRIQEYIDARDELIDKLDLMKELITGFGDHMIGDTETAYRSNLIELLDRLLVPLSYIVGANKREEATLEYNKIKDQIQTWIDFIAIEESVFLKILSLFEPPISFIDTISSQQDLVDSIIEFLDTVNIPFQPDSSWPTYSDIYRATIVEIISGGFRHKVGETVFVPHLGSYKITEVRGDACRAVAIEDLGYRNTTFRDPCSQYNPYDGITDGIGLGITIKPLASERTKIINDQVMEPIVTRIKNAIYLINKGLIGENPYHNIVLGNGVDSIKAIRTEWNSITKVYFDHMTENTREYVGSMVEEIYTVIDPAEAFISKRGEIDVISMLETFERFIHTTYRGMDKNGKLDDSFLYYDQKLRENYNKISNFYGNGTGWTSGSELRQMILDAKSMIDVFKTNLLMSLDEYLELDEILEIYKLLISKIDGIVEIIKELPPLVSPVQDIIDSVSSDIEEMTDEFYQDIWYRIKTVTPARGGKGYKAGDIVEIIPELPTDRDGNPIKTMEDIIKNDVILFQVTDVKDGEVTHIQPMMDYAIPYQIWGIRGTRTKVGDGTGLVLDIASHQLSLLDSTLFDSEESDIAKVPQFDENDMFLFKFENIHDLNMTYEVFYGGEQITRFYQRHLSSDDPLHPKNYDVLYLYANDVMDLRNVSISYPGEHYFIYRIDNVEIKDPGAGYEVGQDIFVDVDELMLRMTVAKLVYGPLKGIAEVMVDATSINETSDPSKDNAKVITDSLNNIDDEFNVGYYDKLTQEGIEKNGIMGEDQYPFVSKRFDELEDGDRNKTFMHPDVEMPSTPGAATEGDPDNNTYQGSRVDNSQVPMEDPHRWNGIMNLVPPTDPFISDSLRIPPNQPVFGEYQLFAEERFYSCSEDQTSDIHDITSTPVVNQTMIKGDLTVRNFKDLPKTVDDWPEGKIGKVVIVEKDETNNDRRMAYRVRTFVAAGNFIYNLPVFADYKWNSLTVDWMDIDFYPDYPSEKAQYPTAPWGTESYRKIQEGIVDGRYPECNIPSKENHTTYIRDLAVDDLSVFNWTTKSWEDLHDESRWKLDTWEDVEKESYGFKLTFLEEGYYDYQMKFYFNKTPDNQMRNAELKRDAVIDIRGVISNEINKAPISTFIYTGRHLRIRKLFPYEQKETFTLGPNNYEMDFKLAPYLHFRNEIHLEDIKIYNRSASRFENLMNNRMFEVRFKDPKAVSRGYETQTNIIQSLISKAGEGFVDGEVWAYNEEFGIHIFGSVTADFTKNGNILTFTPLHCPNPPQRDITLEFNVYQHVTQTDITMATIIVEFKTEKVEVWGDGYIHNVKNRYAPVPNEFKIIVKYDLYDDQIYDVIISKTPRTWTFVKPEWMMTPTFQIPDYSIQQDRLYVLTTGGRFPLINPSTGEPTLRVIENDNGTSVTFMNLYRRFEHLEIHSTPYPMRSVYVQRRIPQSGYIDLAGKLNKPLNKKYFEFWVNGKLLFDEVTIISPTKLFLHGLTSLKNLEIIEVNRDPNEFFSDEFLEVKESLRNPQPYWNYDTYLDDALQGTLEGDNYTIEEQEYLLTPVWRQVEKDHPEFKNYPPNVDVDDDILTRVKHEDHPINDLDNPMHQFMVVDPPTLEGRPIIGNLKFSHFGWIPISNDMIIEMLNEEWADEISKIPNFPEHTIISDDEWYGLAARLYDEYGILVHNLNEAAYKVTDHNLIKINTGSKLCRIVRNSTIYDLD